MRVKWIIIIVVILFVGLIGFRVVSSLQKGATKTVETQLVPVNVAAVQERTIQDVVILTGNITAEKVVAVASKISGRVLSIPVAEGQLIAAGQRIALIESSDLENALQIAQQGLITATANYDNAKLNYDRSQKLLKDGLISQQQMDAAQVSLTAAASAKRSAELSVNQINDQLASQGWKANGGTGTATGGSQVIAPISGVILKKQAEEGMLVGPSSPNPLVTIGVIDRLKVIVNVEEKLLSYLRIGQNVPITVDAWPDQTFSGTISNILPQVDPISRTITIEALVANPGRKLLPGMFAKARIVRKSADRVIAVPTKAVLEDEQGKYVFLLEDRKAVLHRVKVGLADEQYVQILSGINLGDQLIVAGQHTVTSGAAVEVVGRAK